MRIEIRHLRKSFGAVAALRDVSLEIPAGRRVALVGPNGSGKSTLIRAVLGLYGCEGEILIDGRSLVAERARLASRMAYVPQVAPQLGAPVRELVDAIAELRGVDPARVAEVARELDLHVADIASRPFRNLSGGMKQKLCIALALAGDAELIVMDEPTASLDSGARERFFRLFDERAANATLLLCSHRVEEVRHLVHEVVHMAEGRVVSRQTAVEFVAEARAAYARELVLEREVARVQN